MREQILIIRMLLFVCVAMVLTADAWNPGIQLRLDCGLAVSGGYTYQLICPENDGGSIDIHTIQSGATDTILKVEEPFEDVQLSPSCQWISYRKYDRSISKCAVRIVSRTAQRLRTLTDVRYYAWGSDASGADCIAYIVGEDSESEGYQSRGTWLLNMETGEDRQIHPRGQEIAWAAFDQCFYIGTWPNDSPKSREVQRYSLEEKKLEVTQYHGVDFSTNGTYYHTRSDDGNDLEVYLRTTNENITSRYTQMLNRYFNGDPNFWLNNSMIVFPSARANKTKNRIVNFDRSEAWEVEEEVVGFADKDEKFLLVLVDGKVVTRKFEDVAKLIYPVPDAEAGKATPTEKKAE